MRSFLPYRCSRPQLAPRGAARGLLLLLATATLAAADPVAAQEADVLVGVRTVASGLDFPAAFAVAPGGRIFYGERFTGRIRIFDPSTSSNTLFFRITDVVSGNERGLLGLELHPDYPAQPFVYVFVSRDVGSGPESQVLRIRDSGGQGGSVKLLFSDVSGEHHNGSRVIFGPDERLYVSIGDRSGGAGAVQKLSSNAGKILRMTANGSLPADNPFSGSYVFALGFRNPFGAAFDPETGRMWVTDNGPTCNDELNRVKPAGNYGWGPKATCDRPPSAPRNTNQDGQNPILPRAFYANPVAPTGLAFCSSCGLGPNEEGRLFYGTFVTRQIRRVQLNSSRFGVAFENLAYAHDAPILGVETGPDGRIYFSTPGAILRLKQP